MAVSREWNVTGGLSDRHILRSPSGSCLTWQERARKKNQYPGKGEVLQPIVHKLCRRRQLSGGDRKERTHMNGLVDRSTSFVNALITLADVAVSKGPNGEDLNWPEDFFRRAPLMKNFFVTCLLLWASSFDAAGNLVSKVDPSVRETLDMIRENCRYGIGQSLAGQITSSKYNISEDVLSTVFSLDIQVNRRPIKAELSFNCRIPRTPSGYEPEPTSATTARDEISGRFRWAILQTRCMAKRI